MARVAHLPPRTDHGFTNAGRPPNWRPAGPSPEEPDDVGWHYRGCRRAARHRGTLTLVAALLVVTAVLLVAAAVPFRHGMQPVAGGATPAPSTATGLPATYLADGPANTLFGSARIQTYPGTTDGVIVHTLGNWGPDIGAGALRVNDVVVPATGAYALTLYYVLPNSEPIRSVVITASGSASVSVTVAGNAICCSWQMVRVDLNKGTNSITFSNPVGHAPAIDKIVISQL
jgi:hypothetical protein